jgi:predicted lipid carrier protein YhbT
MSGTDAATPSTTVPQIFARLAAQGQAPTLRRTSGTYEFDIENEGKWFVKLDHGTPSLEQKSEHPDCVITCKAADFIAIAQGERNLVTTYLQGRMNYSGDLAFALTFRRLVPVAA